MHQTLLRSIQQDRHFLKSTCFERRNRFSCGGVWVMFAVGWVQAVCGRLGKHRTIWLAIVLGTSLNSINNNRALSHSSVLIFSPSEKKHQIRQYSKRHSQNMSRCVFSLSSKDRSLRQTLPFRTALETNRNSGNASTHLPTHRSVSAQIWAVFTKYPLHVLYHLFSASSKVVFNTSWTTLEMFEMNVSHPIISHLRTDREELGTPRFARARGSLADDRLMYSQNWPGEVISIDPMYLSKLVRSERNLMPWSSWQKLSSTVICWQILPSTWEKNFTPGQRQRNSPKRCGSSLAGFLVNWSHQFQDVTPEIYWLKKKNWCGELGSHTHNRCVTKALENTQKSFHLKSRQNLGLHSDLAYSNQIKFFEDHK